MSKAARGEKEAVEVATVAVKNLISRCSSLFWDRFTRHMSTSFSRKRLFAFSSPFSLSSSRCFRASCQPLIKVYVPDLETISHVKLITEKEKREKTFIARSNEEISLRCNFSTAFIFFFYCEVENDRSGQLKPLQYTKLIHRIIIYDNQHELQSMFMFKVLRGHQNGSSLYATIRKIASCSFFVGSHAILPWKLLAKTSNLRFSVF